MQKRVALWAFVVAALALTAWGVVSYVNPNLACRGETMGPGDVCHYSSRVQEETTTVQTYEQRLAEARGQTPYVIGLGVIMTAFGVVVAVRSGKQGHGPEYGPVLLEEGDLTHAEAHEVGEVDR
ncbi:MAG: hypothetical protein GX596_11290 [Propionibacterium sp.]|nr:hypothetical protein [Propionibacterium sp.]